MVRYLIVSALLAGCVAGADVAESAQDISASSLSFTREHVTADIYHYEAVIPVGSTPNAALRIHRIVREIAPFVPRPTSHAAMLLHGDFATFVTNFAPTLGDPASPAPGLAPFLAANDVDVWGVDRRWTLPGETDDISDFGAMGLVQELGDLHTAIAIARGMRGGGQLALVGFSHGAELAYTYEASDGAGIDALVALDFFGAYGSDEADLQAASCANADAEYAAVAAGETDSPNDFLIEAGELAQSNPNDPSPLLDGFTNRGVSLLLLGQTFEFAPIAPVYHLLSPILDDTDTPTGLRLTTETIGNTWLAQSPPHESELEAADFDAQLCGQAPPVDAPMSRIAVPLLYLGAAGGVGALGLDTTQQVSSHDVTTHVFQLFGADQADADVGHGDLLYAGRARAQVWQPLAAWLAGH